ncbi:hypothetical protein PSYAC_29366, partial [Pseudomonas syringae pv. actinidiae str. M302091]
CATAQLGAFLRTQDDILGAHFFASNGVINEQA